MACCGHHVAAWKLVYMGCCRLIRHHGDCNGVLPGLGHKAIWNTDKNHIQMINTAIVSSINLGTKAEIK